jgi:hypothetical protein
LPAGYQYVVYDPTNGQVLFHSDDSRSLIENIYEETDNANELAALSVLSSEAFVYGVNYQGRKHTGRVTNLERSGLGDNHNRRALPWKLLVLSQDDLYEQLLFNSALLTVAHYFGYLMWLALIVVFPIIILGKTSAVWLWPGRSNPTAFAVQGTLALVGSAALSVYCASGLDTATPFVLRLLAMPMLGFSALYLFSARSAGRPLATWLAASVGVSFSVWLLWLALPSFDEWNPAPRLWATEFTYLLALLMVWQFPRNYPAAQPTKNANQDSGNAGYEIATDEVRDAPAPRSTTAMGACTVSFLQTHTEKLRITFMVFGVMIFSVAPALLLFYDALGHQMSAAAQYNEKYVEHMVKETSARKQASYPSRNPAPTAGAVTAAIGKAGRSESLPDVCEGIYTFSHVTPASTAAGGAPRRYCSLPYIQGGKASQWPGEQFPFLELREIAVRSKKSKDHDEREFFADVTARAVLAYSDLSMLWQLARLEPAQDELNPQVSRPDLVRGAHPSDLIRT